MTGNAWRWLPVAMAAALIWPATASTPAPMAGPYQALGTSAFGPNNHGSYTWFIDTANKQVVMCLVHNPQAPIECKRTAIPGS